MKKLLLLAAMLLVSTGVYARPEWDLKAGWNLTTISTPEVDSKSSLHAGLFVDIRLTDLISLQPEMVYSRQGGKVKKSWYTTTKQRDYINIPVMVKFHVIGNLSLDFGPQMGLMLVHNDRTSGGNISLKSRPKDTILFDIAAATGATYKIFGCVDVYGRYNLGFRNTSTHGKSRNRVFQLGVGYRF